MGMWMCLLSLDHHPGVFGVIYDGYLSNAEEDVEGAIPVIIKTVKGVCVWGEGVRMGEGLRMGREDVRMGEGGCEDGGGRM